MHGLLKELSTSAPVAANVLRIIEFYDRLLLAGASNLALVRATAGLLHCTVGLQNRVGTVRRATPAGSLDPELPSPEAMTTSCPIPEGGLVWVERVDGEDAFDEIVLERMALTAALARGLPANLALRRESVELLLLDDMDPRQRRHAIEVLGLDPARRYRVCAVTTKATGDPEHMSDIDSSTLSTTSAAQAFIDARRFPALTIPVDDDLLIIIPADDDALCPAIAVEVNDQLSSPMSTTLAIGISDPATLASAPVLWHRAQIAARFSGIDDLGFGAAVSYSELGALAFLAEQDPAAVRAHPAIKALSALAEKPHGAEDLRLLRAFISSGSLRRAAKELHLHHSSVSAAALRIQETLGVSATSPVQRLATLATLIAYDLSTARASIIP